MRPYTVFISDGNRVPIGAGQLRFQYGSWWIVAVMASRTAPPGAGKQVLKALCIYARTQGCSEVRLGTNYNNIPMLMCALHTGFRLEGCDRNGYVLRRKL